MSDDEAADLWPVLLSEIVGDTLSNLGVSPALFSVVAALTVAICETRGLKGATALKTIQTGGRSSSQRDAASRNTGSTGPTMR